MSDRILMKNGIASWMVKKTKLTDYQIARFCEMHELEIEALRTATVPFVLSNPIDQDLLSAEEIARCENDPYSSLRLKELSIGSVKNRRTRSSAKKQEVVNAILWLLNKYPQLSDVKIAKLLKCTKVLVSDVRSKTYKGLEDIVPKHPIVIGLCNKEDLDELINSL